MSETVAKANASARAAKSSAKGTERGRRAEEKLRAFHEEIDVAKGYDLLLIRKLWPFVKPHARYLALSLAALLVVISMKLAQPRIAGDIVKRAGEGDAAGLLRDGCLLAGLLVVTQTLGFLQVYSMQLAGARAMAGLRAHIFVFYQGLRLRYFDKTPVGRLVTRAVNDVDAINELFAQGVLNGIGDLLILVGIVAMMVSLHLRLSLIAFAALPFVGLIVMFVRKRSRLAYRDIRTKTARLNAFLNEQVNGIAVVQAYAREEAMAEEFDAINDAFRDANKRSIYYEALLDASIEMVSSLCIASILWWGGLNRALDKSITFPLVVTFTQYIKAFFEPISMLSARFTILQSALSGAERVFQLLDEKDTDEPSRGSLECAPDGPSDEALALLHVDFEYKPGVPVLRDVSLTAKRGEKIALVGATGAGKTTVSSLLLRLYEVTRGAVRVLGKDVRSMDRHALREQFSVVPQDVYLFAGSIASNVAMTADEPDIARVEEVLRRVGAYEAFAKREGGLLGRVDERGANFSAGERQLLAFARALYKDSPILILDEATASVDSDTEAKLQRALEVLLVDRTSLIIAHRLSTIRAASRIIVFHKGRVVEDGTHEELLAKGEIYARLYRLQHAQERAKEPFGAQAIAS